MFVKEGLAKASLALGRIEKVAPVFLATRGMVPRCKQYIPQKLPP